MPASPPDRLEALSTEMLKDWKYDGILLLSDIHVGVWEEFSQTETMTTVLTAMIRHAIERNLLPVLNGDIIDRYPHVEEHNRLRDAALLKPVLAQLQEGPANRPMLVELPGNHDPGINESDVETYLGVPPDRAKIAAPFLALGETGLITHGHYLEVGRISNILKEVREAMPDLPRLQKGRMPPLNADQRDRIVHTLNNDPDLVSQQRDIEEGFHLPSEKALQRLGRWRWHVEHLGNGALSLNGLVGRWMTLAAERMRSPSVQEILREMADFFGLTLMKRALRVGKQLGFRGIFTGHDHSAELLESDGTVYGNSGSILQVGQRDTCLTVDMNGEWLVRLLRYRHKKQKMKVLEEEVVQAF